MRLVLQRLLENILFVKAKKCEFHVPSVSFLGFIIEQEQVKSDPAKFPSGPLPPPTSSYKVFWGFANFYRSFIRDYSRVAAPLTKLTSTASPFVWSPKELFTAALVLFDPARQFVVEVNASDTGVDAVLSQ